MTSGTQAIFSFSGTALYSKEPPSSTTQLTIVSNLELLKGMSFPAWVKNEEDEVMFGKAAGFGADNVVLLSKVTAGAFIAVKESAGKF